MTVQTVELAGRRFVIVPEEDFRALERRATAGRAAEPRPRGRFAAVRPLKVPGIPASELLIRDRR